MPDIRSTTLFLPTAEDFQHGALHITNKACSHRLILPEGSRAEYIERVDHGTHDSKGSSYIPNHV